MESSNIEKKIKKIFFLYFGLTTKNEGKYFIFIFFDKIVIKFADENLMKIKFQMIPLDETKIIFTVIIT